MNVIKRYTAIILDTKTINNKSVLELSYGNVRGYYDSLEYPTKIHDTEEEAIKYAYDQNKYGRWLILPVITFE